jgi:hypothetical protein
MTPFKYFFLLVLISTAWISCDKDSDDPGNEGELITSVIISLVKVESSPLQFSVKDLDGDGGNPPIAEEIKLATNTTYSFTLKFMDESKVGAPVDITTEIANEADEHLVCFIADGSVSSPVVTDKDGKGNPLGLAGTISTTGAGIGSLKVTLKHLPNKSSSSPCSTGETDAEVTFPIRVQ